MPLLTSNQWLCLIVPHRCSTVIYCLNTIPLKSFPNLKLFLIPSRTLIPLIRTYKKIRLIKLGTNKKTVFLKSRFFTQKKIKHDLRRFFKKGRKYLIHFKTRTAFLSPLKKKIFTSQERKHDLQNLFFKWS